MFMSEIDPPSVSLARAADVADPDVASPSPTPPSSGAPNADHAAHDSSFDARLRVLVAARPDEGPSFFAKILSGEFPTWTKSASELKYKVNRLRKQIVADAAATEKAAAAAEKSRRKEMLEAERRTVAAAEDRRWRDSLFAACGEKITRLDVGASAPASGEKAASGGAATGQLSIPNQARSTTIDDWRRDFMLDKISSCSAKSKAPAALGPENPTRNAPSAGAAHRGRGVPNTRRDVSKERPNVRPETTKNNLLMISDAASLDAASVGLVFAQCVPPEVATCELLDRVRALDGDDENEGCVDPYLFCQTWMKSAEGEMPDGDASLNLMHIAAACDDKMENEKEVKRVVGGKKENENCAICLDELCEGEEVSELRCGHAYHPKCLGGVRAGVGDSISCSLCHDPLPSRKIIRSIRIPTKKSPNSDDEVEGPGEFFGFSQSAIGRRYYMSMENSRTPGIGARDYDSSGCGAELPQRFSIA